MIRIGFDENGSRHRVVETLVNFLNRPDEGSTYIVHGPRLAGKGTAIQVAFAKTKDSVIAIPKSIETSAELVATTAINLEWWQTQFEDSGLRHSYSGKLPSNFSATPSEEVRKSRIVERLTDIKSANPNRQVAVAVRVPNRCDVSGAESAKALDFVVNQSVKVVFEATTADAGGYPCDQQNRSFVGAIRREEIAEYAGKLRAKPLGALVNEIYQIAGTHIALVVWCFTLLNGRSREFLGTGMNAVQRRRDFFVSEISVHRGLVDAISSTLTALPRDAYQEFESLCKKAKNTNLESLSTRGLVVQLKRKWAPAVLSEQIYLRMKEEEKVITEAVGSFLVGKLLSGAANAAVNAYVQSEYGAATTFYVDALQRAFDAVSSCKAEGQPDGQPVVDVRRALSYFNWSELDHTYAARTMKDESRIVDDLKRYAAGAMAPEQLDQCIKEALHLADKFWVQSISWPGDKRAEALRNQILINAAILGDRVNPTPETAYRNVSSRTATDNPIPDMSRLVLDPRFGILTSEEVETSKARGYEGEACRLLRGDFVDVLAARYREAGFLNIAVVDEQVAFAERKEGIGEKARVRICQERVKESDQKLKNLAKQIRDECQ